MNKTASLHRIPGLIIVFFFVFCLALIPRLSQGQNTGYSEPSEYFTQEEIAQLLAPIALYPDTLLSQILMASTYPIEVIEADRWLRNNPGLKGGALDRALLDMTWEPSVKAMAHFPTVLSLMSERIADTTDLGNAFLAQEGEVLDMVQELRAKAYAHGNLGTTVQQKVVVEKETIIIQPANPRVIYVPYYDPFHVYGSWWYPAYPPAYWGPSRASLAVGISFWPASYFSFSFGTWSYFDWRRHHIYIDVHQRPRFVRSTRWIDRPGRWQHAPSHRWGVAYRDRHTARKYGQTYRISSEIRRDSRALPKRVEADRSRGGWGGDRARVERDKRREDRYRDDRSALERKLQEKRRTGRDQGHRQQPAKFDGNRPERQQVERDRPNKREQGDGGQRRIITPDRQQHQPAAREQLQRVKVDRDQRQKDVAEENQRQKSGDQVVDRGEDGRDTRVAREDNRSRQQDQGGEARGRGRSGGDNREPRDAPDRNVR